METWREVWRKGVAPHLPAEGLRALAVALECDDPLLIQGATTDPPPMDFATDWPVEAACPVGFCGWQGAGRVTAYLAEEFFGAVCFEADQAIGEPAACRWFNNWWDETPRDLARPELLAEVRLELARRATPEGA